MLDGNLHTHTNIKRKIVSSSSAHRTVTKKKKLQKEVLINSKVIYHWDHILSPRWNSIGKQNMKGYCLSTSICLRVSHWLSLVTSDWLLKQEEQTHPIPGLLNCLQCLGSELRFRAASNGVVDTMWPLEGSDTSYLSLFTREHQLLHQFVCNIKTSFSFF